MTRETIKELREVIKELRDASDNEVRYGDIEHHYNEVMKRVESFDIAIKVLEKQLMELENNYANFGKDVIGIITSFSTSDEEKIKEIIELIDKYSDVKRDYNSCIGMFS